MAKEGRPAMLFYGREFFGDLNVMAMTLEERGAYVHMCWLCWAEGSIPDDARIIARIVQPADVEAFVSQSFPKLRACFDVAEGRLVHGTVEKIRGEVKEFSRGQSERALRGWEKRRNKDAGSMPDECRNDAKSMPPISDLRSPISDLQSAKENTCAPNAARVCDSSFLEGEKHKTAHTVRKKGTPSAEQLVWFTEFWECYWLRKSKKDAANAFYKAVKTQAMFDAVMVAVKAQSPEMLNRPADKRPYAASWVNAERWLDDVAETGPAVPKAEKW